MALLVFCKVLLVDWIITADVREAFKLHKLWPYRIRRTAKISEVLKYEPYSTQKAQGQYTDEDIENAIYNKLY